CSWSLFLRYQVQTERHYRRAVEEFERLKALRATASGTGLPACPSSPEIPNGPIWEAQREQNEPPYLSGNEPVARSEPGLASAIPSEHTQPQAGRKPRPLAPAGTSLREVPAIDWC